MGLLIYHETESGERLELVADRGQIFMKAVRSTREHYDYPRQIDFIDEYGVTLFNAFQQRVIIGELKELETMVDDEATLEIIREFRELTKRCSEKVHHYIRILGD